jgi:hypothetical protein
VVLDIGDGVGALVLYVPAALHGREIEVSPVGEDAMRTHTAVLERLVNGQRVYAAVYPELAAGVYRVWGDQATPTVSIHPGAVAELDWR